jgi:hypothetical protein
VRITEELLEWKSSGSGLGNIKRISWKILEYYERCLDAMGVRIAQSLC